MRSNYVQYLGTWTDRYMDVVMGCMHGGDDREGGAHQRRGAGSEGRIGDKGHGGAKEAINKVRKF